eukprot:scaffold3396_cov176-Amphora_coffeaeformis.AAC.8
MMCNKSTRQCFLCRFLSVCGCRFHSAVGSIKGSEAAMNCCWLLREDERSLGLKVRPRSVGGTR